MIEFSFKIGGQPKKKKALSDGFFNSGSKNRRPTKGCKPKELEPAEVIQKDLPGLRAKSQELLKNHPKARGIINTMTTYTVGTGLDLDLQFDNKTLGLSDEALMDLKDQVELLWEIYKRECDATGQFTLDLLQGQIFRAMLADGDAFVYLPIIPPEGSELFATKIQYVPAAQVSNKDGEQNSSKMQNGIIIGKFGKPAKLKIRSRFPNSQQQGDIPDGFKEFSIVDPTGRKQFLHVFNPDFSNQYRGYPLLSTIIESLKSGDEYSALELMAARFNAAFFAVAPYEDDGGEEAIDPGHEGDAMLSQTTPDGGDFGPNTLIYSNAPDKYKIIPPSRPNDQYGPFMDARHNEESMGVSLPPEVINKKYVTSFSAARSAQADAYRVFRSFALNFKEQFMRPIFEAFMDECVTKGLIQAPGYFEDTIKRRAYLRVDFTGQAMTQLDPVKEAKAYEIYLKNRIMTLDEVSRAVTNKSFIDKADQIQREQQIMKEKGILPVEANNEGVDDVQDTPIEET